MRLPATSANLGAAFDTAAVALGFHLEISADISDEFSIAASGRNSDLCSILEGNLILKTYSRLLEREGVTAPPLALTMHNQIPLGMGCGSSAAGRLGAIAIAVHFGRLSWSSDQVLAEACAEEGHPDNAAACWLGGLVLAACEGAIVHSVRVVPPADWRALVVIPTEPVATSEARGILPGQYSRADAVANIQAASLLGLAFAQARADLLRPAMTDRIHQPYRAEICPLLPRLLPLAGTEGVLGVALSGAGPSVLLVVESSDSVPNATALVLEALGSEVDAEILVTGFESTGAISDFI